MAIGFVNSGLMDLKSAVWIIMGANIRTTITGQLIALNFSAYAPLILFAGVLLAMFAAKGRSRSSGPSLNWAWYALHGAGAHVPIHGATPLYARIYWSLG